MNAKIIKRLFVLIVQKVLVVSIWSQVNHPSNKYPCFFKEAYKKIRFACRVRVQMLSLLSGSGGTVPWSCTQGQGAESAQHPRARQYYFIVHKSNTRPFKSFTVWLHQSHHICHTVCVFFLDLSPWIKNIHYLFLVIYNSLTTWYLRLM